MDSGFQVLDSGFNKLNQVPKPRVSDSTSKNFLASGFYKKPESRFPNMVQKTTIDLLKLFATNLNLPSTIIFNDA